MLRRFFGKIYDKIKESKALKRIIALIFICMVSYTAIASSIIKETVDNNTGYFAVHIRTQGSFFRESLNIIRFYDDKGNMLRSIEVKGDRVFFSIKGDAEKVILYKEGRGASAVECCYDYYGNEIADPDMTDKPVTRVYSPRSNPFTINHMKNFFGYEYLLTDNNGQKNEIHFENDFFVSKYLAAVHTFIIGLIIMYAFENVTEKIKKSE